MSTPEEATEFPQVTYLPDDTIVVIDSEAATQLMIQTHLASIARLCLALGDHAEPKPFEIVISDTIVKAFRTEMFGDDILVIGDSRLSVKSDDPSEKPRKVSHVLVLEYTRNKWRPVGRMFVADREDCMNSDIRNLYLLAMRG